MGGWLLIMDFMGGGGSSGAATLVGQWSNVMLLESNQPIVTLYGQDTITLGSDQTTYRVEMD